MFSKACDNSHPEVDRYFYALKGLRVLVVDDNMDSLELVRIILEEYSVQVITAISASEALRASKHPTRYPDLRYRHASSRRLFAASPDKKPSARTGRADTGYCPDCFCD